MPNGQSSLFELKNQYGEQIATVIQGKQGVIGVLGIGMVVDNKKLFSPIGSSSVKQMVETMLYYNIDEELWCVCSRRDKNGF